MTKQIDESSLMIRMLLNRNSGINAFSLKKFDDDWTMNKSMLK